LLADIRSFMDGDRKRDGIDTIAKFYRHAAFIRNFFLVAVPYAFDMDPDQNSAF
jgi:hypothetical protein